MGRLISASLREKVINASKHTCKICSADLRNEEIEIDHIVPWAQGGSSDFDNLQATCKKCNRDKRDTCNGLVYSYGEWFVEGIEGKAHVCHITRGYELPYTEVGLINNHGASVTAIHVCRKAWATEKTASDYLHIETKIFRHKVDIIKTMQCIYAEKEVDRVLMNGRTSITFNIKELDRIERVVDEIYSKHGIKGYKRND